ncbi:AMP-binding protein [Aestuariimicrobium ganziense]|uniref:AMP-binding protein n=1 Tax=Aestuariimicrobium ganziense TaxID=2773677 RepID=UPI001F27F845|nr:AMP-binding protein [Aestuariimicrobium ganziense]
MSAGRPATAATLAVREMRDFVLENTADYEKLRAGFEWPRLEEFNFGLEWFDVVAGEHPDRIAVKIVEDDLTESQISYGELAARSDQVANWLIDLGMQRGDTMIVMLHNTIELWEVLLGLTKMGAVAIPTSTLVSEVDLAWRIETAQARFAIAPNDLLAKFSQVPQGRIVSIGIGEDLPEGWVDYRDSSRAATEFEPSAPTKADDLCLLYFTSGTTWRPKLVEHTHVSYPVGHLSTMYWLGVRPGDVHLNISSPGWGKHAWSNFYSPFLAQATVFIFNFNRFHAETLMQIMDTHEVSSFCAPPTVWRMLIQADLSKLTKPPRELVGAGEALNPEVINKVRAAWGNTIRDGYGQTEMTCSIGNGPGQPITLGAMGRPMPGYQVALLDTATEEVIEGVGEGEICLDLSSPNIALMRGYHDDQAMTDQARRNGYYHTGDVGRRNDDGSITYVGRADDVFKASHYKISPFELESALMLHDAVAECAVVASPDELRGNVPKAYVLLAQGHAADADVARSIFVHARQYLNGYQLVRIIEFVEELPKTVSSKIRRVELREAEAQRVASGSTDRQWFERALRRSTSQ